MNCPQPAANALRPRPALARQGQKSQQHKVNQRQQQPLQKAVPSPARESRWPAPTRRLAPFLVVQLARPCGRSPRGPGAHRHPESRKHRALPAGQHPAGMLLAVPFRGSGGAVSRRTRRSFFANSRTISAVRSLDPSSSTISSSSTPREASTDSIAAVIERLLIPRRNQHRNRRQRPLVPRPSRPAKQQHIHGKQQRRNGRKSRKSMHADHAGMIVVNPRQSMWNQAIQKLGSLANSKSSIVQTSVVVMIGPAGHGASEIASKLVNPPMPPDPYRTVSNAAGSRSIASIASSSSVAAIA
jgi:hypothetical protein